MPRRIQETSSNLLYRLTEIITYTHAEWWASLRFDDLNFVTIYGSGRKEEWLPNGENPPGFGFLHSLQFSFGSRMNQTGENRLKGSTVMKTAVIRPTPTDHSTELKKFLYVNLAGQISKFQNINSQLPNASTAHEAKHKV